MPKKRKYVPPSRSLGPGKKGYCNRGSISFKKRFFTWLLFFILVTTTAAVWYVNQDRPTQIKAERVALNILDLIRDSQHMPENIQYGLDMLADKIPLSVGELIPVKTDTYKDDLFYGGLPKGPGLKILKNKGYIVGFNEATKNPAWAAYRIEWKRNFGKALRPRYFETDKRTRAQVTHKNYTNTGYDRGHMAPNYGIAMTKGPKAQLETFLLSNIAPQNPDHNRKIWKNLEMRVAKRISRRFKEIWVVTGPIYSLNPPRKFHSGIAIPDAFFKILIDEYEPNKIRTLSFIIPQTVTGNEPLKPYLTTIDIIEKRTGIQFFSKLSRFEQESLKTSINERVW